MSPLDLKQHLVCPACRFGPLVWSVDHGACPRCDRRYPITDGIPEMVVDEPADRESRRRQIEFFDDEDAEYEISRPHGTPALHRWMLEEKLRRSSAGLNGALRGAQALTVCGGSGMDAEHLARRGATVICADVSPGAVRRARARSRRTGLPIAGLVADAERLPFADRSIELVYVHDGLHHLDRPLAGLDEITRVASSAVSVNEPARALISALAVRLGLALEEEEAGNRVGRMSFEQVIARVESADFTVVHASRYGLFYRHRAGWAMRAFSTRATFPVARVAWEAFNRAAGSHGNKLTVQATRPDSQRSSPR